MSSEIKNEALPSRREVYEALELKLSDMKEKQLPIDVITYAGNGEPTLHPEFPGIIDDSIELRNKYFPEARIAVLSNSSSIEKPEIREALLKVDLNILKLDSVFEQTIKIHNQPYVNLRIEELIKNLELFKGKLIIQTLFVRGIYNDYKIDNTTPEEIEAWLEAIKRIKPLEVMIYTISRDAPQGSRLKKVPLRELQEIASRVEKLGIETQVSG